MKKKEQKKYELLLNHMTATEYLVHHSTFNNYKSIVLLLLQIKDTYLFEDDLLKELNTSTMEQVNLENPDRFVHTGILKKKDDKNVKIWYDLWADYTIKSDDFGHDYFLIHGLRQTDLLEIEDFLTYQLNNHFDNDVILFCRLLQLALRKHEDKNLLEPTHVLTINEWITKHLKEQELSGTGKTLAIKTKGRLKREAEDGLTLLNQEQTVLLIYYLQKAKIIYKGEYLSNTDAGTAFSILTGYSPDTIRQTLGEKELERLRNKKNLSDLANTFTRVLNIIEREIREK